MVSKWLVSGYRFSTSHGELSYGILKGSPKDHLPMIQVETQIAWPFYMACAICVQVCLGWCKKKLHWAHKMCIWNSWNSSVHCCHSNLLLLAKLLHSQHWCSSTIIDPFDIHGLIGSTAQSHTDRWWPSHGGFVRWAKLELTIAARILNI